MSDDDSTTSKGHEEFVATLESFKELKSGISGSRIKKLTTYALDHIEDENELISLIIDYSKTCPDTHKLGSLYIIDSIGRAYLDETKSQDIPITSTASPGTQAHAIFTLGEHIKELLSDAIEKSNEDRKSKIRLLVDIWDRSGLFQKSCLNSVRGKYFSMDETDNTSSNTPAVTATSNWPQDPQERSIQILKHLTPPPESVLQVTLPDNLSSSNKDDQRSALSGLLLLIQEKYKNMQPYIQKASIESQSIERETLPPKKTQTVGNVGANTHNSGDYGARRERERYASRSNRSRSPIVRKENLNHGHSSVMGASNHNFGTNNHHLYPDEINVPENPHYRPKPVMMDPSLPPDHIKVLSRTLFVGGVPMNMKEWDIANTLKSYAEVQSVILNNARKHAFVKVYSRAEAENVLREFNRDGSSPLRTRWGVGFGPRDCCDYQHGFSIIPMHRLTDADKKWSMSAQWGGTGGQQLISGLTFEEPDIVVGEGVSSKAISQKMPTDSGRNGPRSGKTGPNTSKVPVMMAAPVQPVPMSGSAYTSPPSNYIQMQQFMPQQPQPMAYNQPSIGMTPMDSYGQPAPASVPAPLVSPPMPQQQQSYDATAQLNSLMSMLNQQQQN